LALARREVQKSQATMEDLLVRVNTTVAPLQESALPYANARVRPWREWWLALTGRAQPPRPPATADLEHRLLEMEKELAELRQADAVRGQAASQIRQVFSSIIVGYTMSLQRLERAIAQHGLETIDCVGEP